MSTVDFHRYYDLESYLFETVRRTFQEKGSLSAFDFFCIVIWKANRAKSKIANRLKKRGHENLDEAVRELTIGIPQQPAPKDKLRYLWEEWGFRLPMASAILAVLYPAEFTVYDARTCAELDGFHNLSDAADFDALWNGYQDFKQAVENQTPEGLTLRDKDRYLWGKSFYKQLVADIEQGFRSGV